MVAPSVALIGAGARTPLGLRAAPSAAAMRAGLSAARRHPYLVDQQGEMMPSALDAVLDPRLIGPERLLALLETAMAEAAEPIAEIRRLRVAACLALPAPRPGFAERDLRAMEEGARRLGTVVAQGASVQVHPAGHAAGIDALAQAVELLVSGAVDACLVAGVDSHNHPYTMEWLDAERRLLGATARSGFVPGEAAACLLLAGESLVERSGVAPLLGLCDVARGVERATRGSGQPCFGIGLSEVVREAARSLRPGGPRIGRTFCDLNGERHRGEEWGFMCLRAADCFDDPTDYVSPADAWGDVGAASVPLFAALAWQERARGRGRASLALVVAGSDRGERGAALFEARH